jgi:DNA invertase Pin-like site-specific DNA recombinase
MLRVGIVPIFLLVFQKQVNVQHAGQTANRLYFHHRKFRKTRGYMKHTIAAVFRVALYVRVSTFEQHPEMQLQELREYCQRRGWEIVGEFVDEGVSGSKESRPALNRLMLDAKRRKFDAVVCWKLDRFARSLKHLVNALAEFEALGVAFVSLRDNLDLSTPSGRLMFQIIGAMSEFERALIQERVRAGLKNARSKGVQLGRPMIADLATVSRTTLWRRAKALGCAV